MPAALLLYAASILALFSIGAWRDREISNANLTVCSTLALLFGATMLKADLVGIPRTGFVAVGVSLNLSVLVGSGFNPPQMYRLATHASDEYHRMENAGGSDNELDAFDAPSGGTGRTLALWLVAVTVFAISRPDWFGL